MSPVQFWHGLPSGVRATVTHLGRCLGTGSVKQVHVARFVPVESGNAPEAAVAILRKHVEDEALASLGAMETSSELVSDFVGVRARLMR